MYCGVMGSRTPWPSADRGRAPRAKRAAEAQAGGDVVRAVEMRVHHQPLPADSGARLSKYTRITIITRSATSRASAARRCAYSRPATTSWIEHGPATSNSRLSSVKMSRWMSRGRARPAPPARPSSAARPAAWRVTAAVGLNDIGVGCFLHERSTLAGGTGVAQVWANTGNRRHPRPTLVIWAKSCPVAYP